MILEEGATGKDAGVVLGSFFGGRREWTQSAFVFFSGGGGGGGGFYTKKKKKLKTEKLQEQKTFQISQGTAGQ